jgi:hypothetical protein
MIKKQVPELDVNNGAQAGLPYPSGGGGFDNTLIKCSILLVGIQILKLRNIKHNR